MRPKFQRFATFNYFNDKVKQTHIADDLYKFYLAETMALTNSRIHFI